MDERGKHLNEGVLRGKRVYAFREHSIVTILLITAAPVQKITSCFAQHPCFVCKSSYRPPLRTIHQRGARAPRWVDSSCPQSPGEALGLYVARWAIPSCINSGFTAPRLSILCSPREYSSQTQQATTLEHLIYSSRAAERCLHIQLRPLKRRPWGYMPLSTYGLE